MFGQRSQTLGNGKKWKGKPCKNGSHFLHDGGMKEEVRGDRYDGQWLSFTIRDQFSAWFIHAGEAPKEVKRV